MGRRSRGLGLAVLALALGSCGDDVITAPGKSAPAEDELAHIATVYRHKLYRLRDAGTGYWVYIHGHTAISAVPIRGWKPEDAE